MRLYKAAWEGVTVWHQWLTLGGVGLDCLKAPVPSLTIRWLANRRAPHRKINHNFTVLNPPTSRSMQRADARRVPTPALLPALHWPKGLPTRTCMPTSSIRMPHPKPTVGAQGWAPSPPRKRDEFKGNSEYGFGPDVQRGGGVWWPQTPPGSIKITLMHP